MRREHRLFGDPGRQASYHALAVGERFEHLGAVPLIFKDPATGACDAFPTRRGYTDALACVSKSSADPAWVTATFTTGGFLWYALKNTADFRLTLLEAALASASSGRWVLLRNSWGLEMKSVPTAIAGGR